MQSKVEKLGTCEYEMLDKSSEDCHNPPTFIDRKSGTVVCVAHADSLETFLQARATRELDFQAKVTATAMQALDEAIQLQKEADAGESARLAKLAKGVSMEPKGPHGIQAGVK